MQFIYNYYKSVVNDGIHFIGKAMRPLPISRFSDEEHIYQQSKYHLNHLDQKSVTLFKNTIEDTESDNTLALIEKKFCLLSLEPRTAKPIQETMSDLVSDLKKHPLIAKMWDHVEIHFGAAITIEVLAREIVPFGANFTYCISPDNLEKLCKPTIYLADDLNATEMKAGLILQLLYLNGALGLSEVHNNAAQGLYTLEEFIDHVQSTEVSIEKSFRNLTTGSCIEHAIFQESDFPLTLGIPFFDQKLQSPFQLPTFSEFRYKSISDTAQKMHTLGVFKFKSSTKE